jgi:hypothetical protein
MTDTMSKYDDWDTRELDRGLECHVPEIAPGEGIQELLAQSSPVPEWAEWYYSIARHPDVLETDDKPEERPLQWRDLSADEVYHIACLMNEARDATAKYIVAAATINGEDEGIAGISHRYSMITANRHLYMGLIANADARADAWFEDQVLLRRGELPVPPSSPPGDVRDWLQEQLAYDAVKALPKGEVAKIAGLHASNFSTYCYDKVRSAGISIKNIRKLAEAFADIRGLQGKEREELIASALAARYKGITERDKQRRRDEHGITETPSTSYDDDRAAEGFLISRGVFSKRSTITAEILGCISCMLTKASEQMKPSSFSIKDITTCTRSNDKSIRDALKKMLADGVLEVVHEHEAQKGRGRLPRRYRLAESEVAVTLRGLMEPPPVCGLGLDDQR